MVVGTATKPDDVTVLIVDDNERNRLLLETIVRRGTPYEPVLASGGAEALALAAERVPDLVLLDVLMPAMDGYEVARRFKENPALADVPIIFITALAEVEDKVKAFEHGGIDYIVKPIEPREVMSRVTAQIALRLQTREIRRLNRELNLELDLARQIQEAIMPVAALRHPKAVIAGRSLPMEKVSGDYYDVLVLDDDHILVFLADIMGHGVPAALYTMMLKTDLYYLARFTRSPAELFRRLNERLCQVLYEDYFITASLLLIDLTGPPAVLCASAGHPPVIRVSPVDGVVSTFEQNDFFLGWKPDQRFTETRLAVAPGETLLVHTDGFTDAVRQARGAANAAEFVRTAFARGGFHPEEWIRGTMEDFGREGVPQAVEDDITVISVEFTRPA